MGLIVNEGQLEKLYSELEVLEKAREELIKLCREARIHSTKAVARVHAGNMEEAEELLEKARSTLEEIKNYRDYPFYRAISGEAMQEYVEAVVFLNFVRGRKAPEFDLETPPILTGYADAVGEIRRFALDLMRFGKVGEVERCIEAMEEIYSHLVQFSFPEKLVPNLRHKVDLARNLIDRTKSDFLAAKLIGMLER